MTRHRSMSVRSFLLSLAVLSAASAFHLQSSFRSQAQASESHSASLTSTSNVNLQSGGGVRSAVAGVKGGISTLKKGVRHGLSEAHALFEQGSASSTSPHGFSASEAAEAAFPRSNTSGSGKYSISLPKAIRIALHTDNTHFGTNEHNISGTTHNSFSSAVATNNSEMSISNVRLSTGQGYYVAGGGHVSQGSQTETATASDPGQNTGIAGVSSSGFTRGSVSGVGSHASDAGDYIAGEESTSNLNTANTGAVSDVWGGMSGYSSHSVGSAWQPHGIESTISGVHGTSYGNSQGIYSSHGHQVYRPGVQTSSESANPGHTSGNEGTPTEFDGQDVSFSGRHDIPYGGVHNILAGGKAGISAVANLDLSGGVDGSFTKPVRNDFSVVKSYDVPFGGVQNIYAQKEATVSTVSSSGQSVGSSKTVPDFSVHGNSNAFGEGFNSSRQKEGPISGHSIQENPTVNGEGFFPSSNLGILVDKMSSNRSHDGSQLITYEYEHREKVSPAINVGDSFSGSRQSGISVTKIVGHSVNSGYGNSGREEATAFGSNIQSTLFTKPGSLSASGDSTNSNTDNQRHYGLLNPPGRINNPPVFGEHNGHFVTRNHGIVGQMGTDNHRLTNYDYSANYSHGLVVSNFSVGGNGNHSYFGTRKYAEGTSGPGTLVPLRSNDRDTHFETVRSPIYPATQTYSYTYGIHTSTGGENRALSGVETDNHSETGSDTHLIGTHVDMVGSGISDKDLHSSPIENEGLTELGNEGFSGTENHRVTAWEDRRPTGTASLTSVTQKHQDLNEFGNVRGSAFGNMRTPGFSGTHTHRITSHGGEIDINSVVNNSDMPDTEADDCERAKDNGSSDIGPQVVSGFGNQESTKSNIHDQTSTELEGIGVTQSHRASTFTNHDSKVTISHGLTATVGDSLNGDKSYERRDYVSSSLTGNENHDQPRAEHHNFFLGTGSHSQRGHGNRGLNGNGGYGLTGQNVADHEDHSLRGYGRHSLTSSGGHGITGHGSHGLTGRGTHVLDGTHGLSSNVNHGLTGYGSHSLTGYGNHGVTGDGSLGLTGDGNHAPTGDGRQGLTGDGSHGLTEAGRHSLTGFGSHGLTGARGHSVTGFTSYTLTGAGSHGATGARIHEQTSDGSHRLTGAGSHVLAISGNDGLVNSGGQVLTNVGDHVLTHFESHGLTDIESHGLTGDENHVLDGAGGQTVAGSGGHVLTQPRGMSGFESHGSADARGHDSTGTRGYSLTSFKSFKSTGSGIHGLTGAGSHGLTGVRNQVVTVAGGRDLNGAGSHDLTGFGSHGLTEAGGHSVTGDGGHRLTGAGSHGFRTSGNSGSLNAEAQVLAHAGGNGLMGFETSDLTATGGHGLRVAGGYGLTGVVGHGQTHFVSHGLTGARNHGLTGVKGHTLTSVGGRDLTGARSHGITGALNSQSSAGSQYLSTGLSSSHSLKQHSETHGRWEAHTSDGGGRTSGSLYNTHSVGGHSENHGHLETHTSKGGGPIYQSNTGTFMAGGEPTSIHSSSPFRVGVKGH